MNCILDINELAIELQALAQQACLETHEVYDTTRVDWHGLVYLLFVDAIYDRMMWCAPRVVSEFDWEFRGQAAWYNNDADNACTGRFQDLLDSVWMSIQFILDRYIPSRTYVIWTVTRHGSDIILTKGSDYRIADWERAVAAGTIRHPRHKLHGRRPREQYAKIPI